MNRATAGLFAILFCAAAEAVPPQPRGNILNASGLKCWYIQKSSKEKYFHATPGTTSTLVFADSRCMAIAGFDGDVNVRMINFAVSRWHSHEDAAFAVRLDELRKGSLLQVRGHCIQSKRYPQVGIAIEYFEQNGYIVGVKHSHTVGRCTAN